MSNKKRDNLHHKTLSITLPDKIKFDFRAKLLGEEWERECPLIREEFRLGRIMFLSLTDELPRSTVGGPASMITPLLQPPMLIPVSQISFYHTLRKTKHADFTGFGLRSGLREWEHQKLGQGWGFLSQDTFFLLVHLQEALREDPLCRVSW